MAYGAEHSIAGIDVWTGSMFDYTDPNIPTSRIPTLDARDGSDWYADRDLYRVTHPDTPIEQVQAIGRGVCQHV